MKKVVLKSSEGGSENNNEGGSENNNTVTIVEYKECQKNQAVHIGGHAVDGCMEFLASGVEETAALTCACCGCHRNFHRREVRRVPA